MRILVIEDEKKVASFIKRGLEEENFSVDTAYDGVQGQYLAEINDYDLVILDLMLPGKDGLEVCRELRQKETKPLILMLTAKDTVEDRIKGLNIGADDYLVKPFIFEELLARIRAILRRGKPIVSLRLEVGDLVMDPVKHQVTRGGKEIHLTSKEYALLEYLMRHPGDVLTRTKLSEHVWDNDFDTFTNIIDVYINYLRNKIDRGFDKKLIHTVRGVGYMIKA
ncbi:MAG: response regulator transcription factor [Deltaproteobacteria bacterium]|nr:MAG: response regulator transcription factor [Deltaproteobacteria bacterium]